MRETKKDKPGYSGLKTLEIAFSSVGKSKRLAKKNEDYLDLLSVISKSKYMLEAQQNKFKSKPARNAARQVCRQLDLIFNMVQLPHAILMTMEGRVRGAESVYKQLLFGEPPNLEDRQAFEKDFKNTMQRFFALDLSGFLSRPWLFAVSLYAWAAFECLASDLWVSSLNYATPLGHRVLSSITAVDRDNSGLSRRQIDVGLAARYGFDLRRSLGTLLKSKFDFGSFNGVKAAYKQAFGTDGELGDGEGLKELEQVRHLIIHRGGIVDSSFLKLTSIKARPQTMLTLPVPRVTAYVVTMTLGCTALLKIVDEWFTAQETRT